MNVDNMNKLINFLDNKVPQKNFDMWVFACGTTMCIAGHAAILSGWCTLNDDEHFVPTEEAPEPFNRFKYVNPERMAELWLGLHWPIGNSPFYNYNLKTPKEAAELMREIRDLGSNHPEYAPYEEDDEEDEIH